MSSSWVGFLSTKRMHLASMPTNNQSDSFLEKQSLKTNSINSTRSILIFAFWVDARWSAWPSYRNGSISWLKPPDGLWLRQRIRPGRLSFISERVNRKVPRRRAHFPISLAREREVLKYRHQQQLQRSQSNMYGWLHIHIYAGERTGCMCVYARRLMNSLIKNFLFRTGKNPRVCHLAREQQNNYWNGVWVGAAMRCFKSTSICALHPHIQDGKMSIGRTPRRLSFKFAWFWLYV